MVRALAGAGMNRMPIAVCDRVGVERGQDWIGGSVIIDADGYPMAIAEFGKPGCITADVDLHGVTGQAVQRRTTTCTATAAPISTVAPRYWTDGGAPVIARTDSGSGMPALRSGAGTGAP